MFHVLVGTNDSDAEEIRTQAASKRRTLRNWVIPKQAAVGDEVVLFTHFDGFLATARVASSPKPSLFRNRNVYRGALSELTLLPSPVPLEHVADRISDWGWLWQRIKSYTTPSEEIADQLLALIKDYRRGPTKPRSASNRSEPAVSKRGGGFADIPAITPYLFLWNPKKDPNSFRKYERLQREVRAGRPYVTRWICPSKQPQPGDVAIVQRTGSKDNGVFAKGIVTSEPYKNEGGTRIVKLKLDSFLPVGKQIPRKEIIATANYREKWMPMASGNVVPELLYQAIQTIWSKRSSSNDASGGARSLSPSQESLAEDLVGLEGERFRRMMAHRRHEIHLRQEKIASELRKNGSLACEVPGCGFDFVRIYGELGARYAHVHHLRPLSEYKRQQETRLSDLAIVCANCHAMIHRGGECRELHTLIPRPLR